MAFYVGQRVVYIGDGICGPEYSHLNIIMPVKNGIYTIREFTFYDGPGLRVVEIVNPPIDTTYGYLEVCWVQNNFRPFVERKTDISIFQKMLLPQKERV